MTSDGSGLPDKLARGIRLPTVWQEREPEQSRDTLLKWQELMRGLFPRVHATLQVETPDAWRMIYRWGPAPTSGGPSPVLLMAHYDVVPAPADGWTHPPFSGDIADGYVWGRGALDNKLSHLAILEAVETLIAEDYTPERPIVLAFGGDEEIGGRRGAARIAQDFRERGLRFAVTLDEGGIIARGMLAGVDTPVALLGCGEKGHINIRLSVAASGGHASNPPPRDIGESLSRALQACLRRREPLRRSRTVGAFIRSLGALIGGAKGALLRAYPASAAIVHRVLAATPETDSMLRTTHALTMLDGSPAANVLPRRLEATVNMRLLPGDTIDAVQARLRRRLDRAGSAHHVDIGLAPGLDHNEAPPESPSSGPAWEAIAGTIRAVWPQTPVLPYLVTATTDSRHYAAISDAVYRFLPFTIDRHDLSGIHGVDERVSLENIDGALRFYRRLCVGLGGTDW